MKLLIVSSAPIVLLEGQAYMYSPYQKEMMIWAKYTDEIQFCCPIWKEDRKLLVDKISFSTLETIALKEFDIKTISNFFLAFYYSVLNFWLILQSMKTANHIHLRCPGNIGLLASIAQLFFPYKKKTTKYAGNWDPNSKQPWSYRLQKWILSNPFLTRNMRVLVYGEWSNQSKNIVPFFTATYAESDKMDLGEKALVQPIRFIFVGTLVTGKNPLYAIQLVENLYKKGYAVHLEMYGEGEERESLEHYILERHLEKMISLKGNQSKEIVKETYQKSHFVILPSKSEGWPKAIAEGMFWRCVPIATSVSCVPYMLDFGQRGMLLEMDLERDVQQLETVLNNEFDFLAKSKEAADWSRGYTLDVFEEEIRKLLLG